MRSTKTRGVEATIVLREGILRKGDEIATASTKGKVRMLENFLTKPVSEVIAGAPAVVVGFESIPFAGERFIAGKDASSRVAAQ